MRRLIAFVTTLIILTACGDSEFTYKRGVTYFIFDNATHQDATLASAMNIMSPGTFCTITRGIGAKGVTVFTFANNQGLESTKNANAIDLKRTCVLGYNNAIIVGFGNLSSPSTFYAYDRECPNCFDPDMLPMKSKPLSISPEGIATCPVCHRTYNLNTGGNMLTGDKGKGMTRYHASTAGAFGVLSVN